MSARKRRKSSVVTPGRALWFAAGAALLFVAGEAWKLSHSDSGQAWLLAHIGFGDRARVERAIERELRHGAADAGVPADSIHAPAPGEDRWRIGLAPEFSPLQLNAAITQRMREIGADVLAGRESAGPHGEPLVTLRVGLAHRLERRVVIARALRDTESPSPGAARLALVLSGLDDPAAAKLWFALPVPFAVALVPGAPHSAELFRAAHASGREVVLHLPLEPIHYPQVDPGPGTLRVTMDAGQLTSLLRRHLEQAGAVVAVSNDMGSLATQDATVMHALLVELHRRGLPFLHVEPTAGALCKPMAGSLGVIYQQPDVSLEALARTPRGGHDRALEAAWKLALDRSRARSHALVWMRASPALLRWLIEATRPKRLGGVTLAPLAGVLPQAPRP